MLNKGRRYNDCATTATRLACATILLVASHSVPIVAVFVISVLVGVVVFASETNQVKWNRFRLLILILFLRMILSFIEVSSEERERKSLDSRSMSLYLQ